MKLPRLADDCKVDIFLYYEIIDIKYMHTNLLNALFNIAKNQSINLETHYRSKNRVNSMGDALEFFIKDIFCDSLTVKSIAAKNRIYNKHFSYLGNQNNPPDAIIKSGDAIEVKKVETVRAGIALNSSYPKDKLYSDSPMIAKACRNCEDWKVKDLIYVVGVVDSRRLRTLWFVYGDCYAADKEVYEKIRNKISLGVNELQSIEFSKTRELGRVNRVDPLGITYLRVRGMWHIENPSKVFSYIADTDKTVEFSAYAIMR